MHEDEQEIKKRQPKLQWEEVINRWEPPGELHYAAAGRFGLNVWPRRVGYVGCAYYDGEALMKDVSAADELSAKLAVEDGFKKMLEEALAAFGETV